MASLQQLGPYRLLKKLGEGGMGAVYLAEDTQLGRRCALKVLAGEYASSQEFLTRFHREAVATGKLNHPNIVMAYTVGEELGVHFYAMEYCDGEPLDKALERTGQVPWPVALDVVMQVARGVQHAHAHGIVHRDIKPGNIFICTPPGMEDVKEPFPEGFVAKILDLGLSKMLRAGSEASFLTQTGTTLGTPHYISPEQAQSDKQIDGRADIYSLGATFYHLVTGRTPYVGTTTAAVIMQHLRQPVPNPKDVVPAIPNGVAFAIRRMMAKQPSDRYANCAELLEYLGGLVDSERPAIPRGDEAIQIAANASTVPFAVQSRPPVAEAPAVETPFTDLRFVAVAVAAVILVLGILVGVFALRGPPPPSVAEKNARFHEEQKRKRVEVALEKAEQARREAEERAREAEEAVRRSEEKRKAAEAETAKALQRELELNERLLAEVKRRTGAEKRPGAASGREPDGKAQDNAGGPDESPRKTSNDTPSETGRKEPKLYDPVLLEIERWAGQAFQADFAADPTTLARVTGVDDVEGLKRTHGLLARRTVEAESAQRKALDDETATKSRIKALMEKLRVPQRPGATPEDRELDFSLLETLRVQCGKARSDAERMGRAIGFLTFARRMIANRLNILGVEDLDTGTDKPEKGTPYKVYVLNDGTELKAYMAMKMGDQIAIKDEKGEMRTVNASDVKGIRDGP